jgi:F0F1-type ATP synthase assembly protein I
MQPMNDKQQWALVGRYGTIGIEMALAIGIGYFCGSYCDRHYGTAPYGLWVGLFAGVGAAAKAMWRVVKTYQKEFGDDR